MKPSYSIRKNFGYAFAGIRTAWSKSVHVRFDVLFAVFTIALGFVCSIAPSEWLAIVLCIGGMLCAETFNTALEDVVDLASPDIHPLAKSAKDMAAGAALLCSISCLVVGCIVFVPKLGALLGLF